MSTSAYNLGYRDGELVRLGYLPVSSYILQSRGDFPVGGWAKDHGDGYYDAIHGLPKRLA